MSFALTIYSDYICPFCYLHEAVVSALSDDEAIAADWRCIEIYPETPATGKPLERKGRYAGKWDAWVAPFCEELGMTLDFPTFLPNTHEAALATALATELDSGAAFHRAVMHAYWQEQRDIGNPQELEVIAKETGVDDCVAERWSASEYETRVAQHRSDSYDDMATGFPTTMLGEFPLMGLQSPRDFRTHLARYRKVLARQTDA